MLGGKGAPEDFRCRYAVSMEERTWHKFYDDGIGPSIDFEELSVVDFFNQTVRDNPRQKSVTFMNGFMTYQELGDAVDRFATALAGLGVIKDSKVAIQLPNLPQTVIAFFATMKLGAQVVMTNPLYMPPEIEHQWNDAGVEVAVVTDFLFEQKIIDI